MEHWYDTLIATLNYELAYKIILNLNLLNWRWTKYFV